MAAENHVPQLSEGWLEDDFWQIIAEIDILLFLIGACIGVPCVHHCLLDHIIYYKQ